MLSAPSGREGGPSSQSRTTRHNIPNHRSQNRRRSPQIPRDDNRSSRGVSKISRGDRKLRVAPVLSGLAMSRTAPANAGNWGIPSLVDTTDPRITARVGKNATPPPATTVPPRVKASAGKEWFTKVPKRYVVPSEDLINVLNLPRDFHKHYDLNANSILGEGRDSTIKTPP
eukprot:847703-Amorphochlora_amoeboformis.AAC.1